MITSFFLALGGALWLGVLTTLSPCPLATNIAAVSWLAQGAPEKKDLYLRGGFFILGRVLATLLLGWVVLKGIAAVPGLSLSLQKNMNKLVGPLLLGAGVFLLDLLPLRLPWKKATNSCEIVDFGEKKRNVGGAFLLGTGLGLALCPEAAAIFFGALIPLAIREDSLVLVPLIYGIGTGLPIAALAVAANLGAGALTSAFLSAENLERYLRLGTGVIFVGVGFFFIFTHVFPLL